MESSIAILKKDVECSLCQDTLIEPKLLQCFHTFCKLCIKRHAELIDGANVFKCPKCLSETCLPQLSSVEDLQPSLLHSRMLNILAFVESEKVCSVSGSHSSASWHCFDCDRSLCDECEKNHSVFIKDHKVVSVVETKEEDLKLMLRRENNCEHHVEKTVELFCKDCEQIICIECLKHGHEGHSTISMTKHTSAKKAFMSEQLKQLKQQKETMQKRFKLIEEANIELKKTCDKAKQRLKERLQEVIEVLQKNAVELMSQIDETLMKAEKRKVKGQSTLDQTQGAIDYMNKLIENGLPSELIENKIMEENCSILDDNIIKQHVGIVFDSNEELMKQVNVGLGTLKTVELTDPKMSSVEVEGELEAVKKAKLIVLKKSQTGKLTDDFIDVKISPEDDVKIEEKCVRNEEKIEVDFMAKVPGQLTAEVKVNGNHLSNSPLVMNVKPQKMRKTRQFNMKGGYQGSHTFTGIAVNKENSRIAVADYSADCVHVLNTDGDLLLTYGSYGSGQGQLSGSQDLAFLNETDLVISDLGNHRICIVNTTTGKLIKTFGNQGNGDGEFKHPYGVHVDDDGNIIVSDKGNHRVQVFTKDGDYQYKFGFTKQDSFDPFSTVTHHGLFYVSDYNNNVIHVFEKKGNVPTRISTIGGGGSADGQLRRPWGLAIDNDHNLLVCDCGNKRIQKFTLDGRFVGKTCDDIKNPLYIAVLNDGQLLVTCFGSGVFYVE